MKILIKEKNKFRRGASIAIALMIFLLCALAGASAFLMASTNAGRYSHKNEQEYYSVSSAALMMVDLIDGLKYESAIATSTYKREWKYEDVHSTTDGYSLTVPNNGDFSSSSKSKTIYDKLQICPKILSQCNALFPFDVPNEWYERSGEGSAKKPTERPADLTYDFTITVKDHDEFGTVHGRLFMSSSNYNLQFTFTAEGSDEYAITVYWVADKKVNRVTGDATYSYTDREADGSYKTGNLIQTETVQVTVKWNKEDVTISRGAIKNDEKA